MYEIRPDLKARMDATGIPYKIYAEVLDDATMEQFLTCMEVPGVTKAALMPDAHKGYTAPIGSVYAVKDRLYPSMVGFDIGCGMSSARVDIKSKTITPAQLEAIKDQILRDVPIGFTKHDKAQPVMKFDAPHTDFLKTILKETGRYQIGTLGGGNHFLEIGYDRDDNVNVVIHSGSRGVGHKVATHYMKEAAIQSTDESRYQEEFDRTNVDWYNSFIDKKPQYREEQQKKYSKAQAEFVYRRTRARVDNIEDAYSLSLDTQVGQDYLNDMNVALDFAKENRKTMIDKSVKAIEKVLGKSVIVSRFINRNHNHATLEEGMWVHRKGATHARDGMDGVIPGNMVDGSFIVKGLGNSESMFSSSHGAGRVLSRRKAKDTLDLEEFKDATKHLVANHSDSNLDEAPKAYKNIYEVMELQKDLVEVLDQVTPILNIKG